MFFQNAKKPFKLLPLSAAIIGISQANLTTANETQRSDSQDHNSKTIEEVSVFGQQLNSQSSTGSRLNLGILETPATIEVISGDSIRERLDFTVLEAATRSAGFTNEANPGNGGQSIAARGFRGQGAVTKLFDGTGYFNAFGTITFPFDTWGIERIDILKGPSSVLYGEGGIGGAINVIPKRPQQERSGDIRVTVGEDDTTFVGVGLTGGLTEELAYRVDYSNSQSDNWVNNGDSESQMLSLALSWQASDDLNLSLRYDYGDQEPMKYFGIPVADGDFVHQFLADNFDVSDSAITYEDQAVRLKADWNISDTITLQSEYYHLESERFWRTVEFYQWDSNTGLITRSSPLIIGHDMEHDGLRTQLAFNNTFAGMDSRTSVGFEVNDVSFDRPTNFGPGNPNGADFDGDVDVVDPNNFLPGTFSDITNSEEAPDVYSEVMHYAFFAENQLQVTEQLALVQALRYEKADTDYSQVGRDGFDQSADALTGRIGVVYDLQEDTVLYAQYGTGATHPSNSIVRASASNRDADFIKSEQVEVGIKQQLLEGRLKWNLAVFDIVKNDLTEDNPDSTNPDDALFFPEQTSQGFELGFNLQANHTLQVYGNGSILLAKADAEDGTTATSNYVPEKTANLGTSWSPIERWRFIADARYVGERFNASIPIPSYKVVDASAKFNINDDLSLTFKADNLFDELYASAAYYSSTWLVGKPRTFSLTADYQF